MPIQENKILAPYTTFRIGGPARYFWEIQNENEIIEAVNFAKTKNLPIMVIGGGSNLLISDKGFDGLVIRVAIKGINWNEESGASSVRVTAGAGEDWENLVRLSVEKGLYGMEALSSIPGTVGASPVQNVGAYGVEASSIIENVRAFDTEKMQFVTLTNTDCKFCYRDSMFKHNKGRYIISEVTFLLNKQGKPAAGYKDVKEYFENRKIASPTLSQVREAIIEIRKNKLPDWTKWGTAGSFFKNPIISLEEYQVLKQKFPDLPGYKEPDGRYKISLAWILDKVCDAKGLVIGNVGTYEKQALCVIAKPGATASEVVGFAQELMKRVKDKTGLQIEGEVEWAVS